MIETPGVFLTDPLAYAGLHLTVPRAEISQVMGPGLQEVYEAVTAQGIASEGPWFTHHLRRPGEEFDFEICVPVDQAIAPAGRVKPGIWPEMRVALTIYHGSYTGLPEAWAELAAWIKAEGLRPAEDLWEMYLITPDSSRKPQDWRTELNWPLLD